MLDAPTDQALLARARRAPLSSIDDLGQRRWAEHFSLDADTADAESVPQIYQLLRRYDEAFSCERKPQSANQALKISPPWSDCLASAANPKQQNGSTSKAAADIAAFRHFHWLCSIFSWDSCG